MTALILTVTFTLVGLMGLSLKKKLDNLDKAHTEFINRKR